MEWSEQLDVSQEHLAILWKCLAVAHAFTEYLEALRTDETVHCDSVLQIDTATGPLHLGKHQELQYRIAMAEQRPEGMSDMVEVVGCGDVDVREKRLALREGEGVRGGVKEWRYCLSYIFGNCSTTSRSMRSNTHNGATDIVRTICGLL